MRFIPQSSYSIQEIEQQCRDAINPPAVQQVTLRQVGYSNVIQFASRYQQPVAAWVTQTVLMYDFKLLPWTWAQSR